MTTKTSDVVQMEAGVNVRNTWHLRLVQAVAAHYGCEVSFKSRPRIIGGRTTTKVDRALMLKGSVSSVAKAANEVATLALKLNTGSTRYMASLPEGLSPNERKLARRTWLEAEAAKVARRLKEA